MNDLPVELNSQQESLSSQLPVPDRKRVYRRRAWLFGLAPIALLAAILYLWGVTNLYVSASNVYSGPVQYFNVFLIPRAIQVLALCFPVSLILAGYYAVQAKRTPAHPAALPRKKNWPVRITIGLLTVVTLIAIPVVTVWMAEMHPSKTKFGTVPIIVSPTDQLRKTTTPPATENQKTDRVVALDKLGEMSLRNLRTQAELYAYDGGPISYDGWCRTVANDVRGLQLVNCIDDEDTWAISAKTAGSHSLKCVDSVGSIVDGPVSFDTGLCEQQSNLTDVTHVSKQQIEQIIEQSSGVIAAFAKDHDGIELRDVTLVETYEPGKNEFKGVTFDLAPYQAVLLVSGVAKERSDLGSVRPVGFSNFLLSIPAFEVVMPLDTLNTAMDIEFELLILVDVTMWE